MAGAGTWAAAQEWFPRRVLQPWALGPAVVVELVAALPAGDAWAAPVSANPVVAQPPVVRPVSAQPVLRFPAQAQQVASLPLVHSWVRAQQVAALQEPPLVHSGQTVPQADAWSEQLEPVPRVSPQPVRAQQVVALQEPQARSVLPPALVPEWEQRPSALLAPALGLSPPVRACLAASAGPSRPPQSKSNSNASSFRLRQSQATGQ